ncbi:MAG: histidine phosphatase family protein [Bacteroidota bacterium]|nr:histidine phosphatase family protein [Bacteroidota bacterium]
MNLFLIRHGDAENSTYGKKDFDRRLTEKGTIATMNAVSYWKRIIQNFDYIISSPYIRSLQTAEIIASAYNSMDKLLIENMLGCGSKLDNIITLVNSLGGENIACVGHQPDMSHHLSDFISSERAEAEFKKSAIAKIIFRNKAVKGGGILEFLIPPAIFNENLK